jgi:hypothetical protein
MHFGATWKIEHLLLTPRHCVSIRIIMDRLCVLVVRVPGYSPRGLGFDSLRYQIFFQAVCLERGVLNLVRIIEEVLE